VPKGPCFADEATLRAQGKGQEWVEAKQMSMQLRLRSKAKANSLNQDIMRYTPTSLHISFQLSPFFQYAQPTGNKGKIMLSFLTQIEVLYIFNIVSIFIIFRKEK